MNKAYIISVSLILVLGLLLIPTQSAVADDEGWATAGKIFAGVVGLKLLTDAFDNDYTYSTVSYSSPGYSNNCYRGQRVYRGRPQQLWIPGHYESIPQQVWVNGYYKKHWVSPRYEWVWNKCGRRKKVKTSHGYHTRIWVAGYYSTTYVSTWIPGYWQ
ncbi:MAG: hypothetical protein KAI43_08365 [Candidatus Aureabacteria bacterium]|nr:hypothetical protein [Candidatus Auribacterota bacterium]